jgi:hypothetical protein
VKAWKTGIMWNKEGNIHGERYGKTSKTEGQGKETEETRKKSEEEGETGVQQQLH